MRHEPSWWWDIFFTALRATGNVSRAAREAGQRRTAVYEIAELNSEFALFWKVALLAYAEERQQRQAAEKRRRMERARFNLGLI